ncbi:1257_t:CDS:2, partial [Cetraspora pellucida]
YVNNKGLPIQNIAANLQLTASTVQSIVNTFDKEDRIVPKPQDSHAYCGQPAIRKVVNNREKNISVIAAINENRVLHYKSILDLVNAEIYTTFIYKLINIIPNSKFLAMDNISFYRSDVVKETVANTTHQLLYLSLYSLFLNPIENCFSKLKDSVTRNRLKD